MAMTNADLRDDFISQMNRACDGLTARELAIGAGLDVKTAVRYNSILKKMTELNIAEKVENLFYLTDYGKTQVKSALTQREKPVVETENALKTLEKSALEQKENPYNFVTDLVIEDFETRAVSAKEANEAIDNFLTKSDEIKVDNMHIVRTILNKATSDIISRLDTKKPIENRDEKIAKLTEIASQLNAANAAFLNEIAKDLA